MSNTIKEILLDSCHDFVNLRLEAIQKTLDEIKLSLATETKSTAGDKHETGRAMLQLEREKAGEQFAQLSKLKQILSKVVISNTSKTIRLGSVVYTTNANYFIAISAGEIKVENQKFYAISAHTPIAKLIIGKHEGDVVYFREKQFKITSVY